MPADDDHTLIFKAVNSVAVRDAGQTVAIEFASSSSGQSISVVIPAEASHALSRMLTRAQIEGAAERAKPQSVGAEPAPHAGSAPAQNGDVPKGSSPPEAGFGGEEAGSGGSVRSGPLEPPSQEPGTKLASNPVAL